MIINALERIGHPDFNDVVIHFTGRAGPSNRPAQIEKQTDWDRLAAIVGNSRLMGHDMPGSGASAVCFTEATASGCSWLIREGRYSSCGIAFSKAFLFGVGGGPVLQVRGDEWSTVFTWPETMRARAVRLWPGASAEPGEAIPWWLHGRSEWHFEREWRVPTPADGHLSFDLDDIAFLVVPSVDQLQRWVRDTATSNPELSRAVASSRYVVLGPMGIEASNGVRQRRSTTSLESTAKKVSR